jgi:hypothetical protein
MSQGQYDGQEKRSAPRADTHIPLKITQEDGDIVTASVNLSRSGVYCRVNKRLHFMTKLKIQLLLPSQRDDKSVAKTIHCEGVIVRVEPPNEAGCYNIAIFFSEIARRDAEFIDDYIRSCLGKEE